MKEQIDDNQYPIKKENLIVFDIDDTVTNSEHQHQTAFVDSMKYFGINSINTDWASYTHLTDSYILKQNYESNLSKGFNFSFIEEFENYMTHSISTLPSVTEIIGAKEAINSILHNTNYGVSFATGSFIKPAFIKLQQAKILVNEELVIGANQFLSREEIVQSSISKAKEFYNVSSFKNIISVGDGLWDWKTAKNLGLHFIGIGQRNKQEFLSRNVSLHINDWQGFDLINAIHDLGINR